MQGHLSNSSAARAQVVDRRNDRARGKRVLLSDNGAAIPGRGDAISRE